MKSKFGESKGTYYAFSGGGTKKPSMHAREHEGKEETAGIPEALSGAEEQQKKHAACPNTGLPSKRSKQVHSLSFPLLFHVFSFTSIHFISDTLINVSRDIRGLMQKNIFNGSFLWNRERECFKGILYGKDANRDMCLAKCANGFPQLYHDLYDISLRAKANEVSKDDPESSRCFRSTFSDLWKFRLKEISESLTQHLDYPYRAFSSFLDACSSTIADEDHPVWIGARLALRVPIFSSDEMIMLHCIKNAPQNAQVIKLASSKLLHKNSFILQAAAIDSRIVQYLPDHCSADRDLLLKLRKISPGQTWSLGQVASPELLADRDFLSHALMSGDASVLDCVPANSPLLRDREMALLALRHATKGNNRINISQAFFSDKEFLREVIGCGKCLFCWANDDALDDDLALEAAKSDATHVTEIPTRFLHIRAIAKQLVSKSGLSLEYVSASLRKDKEIVMLAVRKDALALKFASNELKSNVDVLSEAMKCGNGRTVEDVFSCISSPDNCQLECLL